MLSGWGEYAYAMTHSPPDDPADLVLPPKPVPPREEDCCRSDCLYCVFNNYDRELERWEEQVAEILKRREALKS